MGQYYHPIVLDADGKILKTMYSHEFDSGLKLMEHSWMTNKFVGAFETLLIMDGPVRVVWAGDYADVEPGTDENLYSMVEEDESQYYRPDVPIYGLTRNYQWYDASGNRLTKPKITTSVDRKNPPNAFPPIVPTMSSHPYLVNHDKGLVVDKRKVPKDSSEYGWRIHPLPILTVEGNDRGGGDLRPERCTGDVKLIGSWARDRISLSKTLPKGYTKLLFDLAEAR